MTGPILVAVGGIPGSGKSTLARALAARLGAALLDLDTLTNPLFTLLADITGADGDFDHPSLRGRVRDARYRCLADTAAEVLAVGCSVVAVAPFTAELAEPLGWQEFSRSTGKQAIASRLVCVHIDQAIAQQRRRGRGLPRDRSLPSMEGAAPVPLTDHVCADGSADPRQQVERLALLLTGGRRAADDDGRPAPASAPPSL